MKTRIFSSLVILLGLMISPSFAADARVFNNPAEPIEISPGELFVISLVSNISTGYGWESDGPQDTGVLQLVSSKYINNPLRPIGGPGKEEWTFIALKSGKTSVTFKYVRPWEKDVPPIQEVTFVVTVKLKRS